MGLFNVVQAMKRFAANPHDDAEFWKPAPLLARLGGRRQDVQLNGHCIMSNAVIVSTARTPLAKSWKGAFNMTHGATLGGHVVKAAVERAGVEPGAVDDVLMGCANPEGATGRNIARQVALRAGLPITVTGVTVNRFCSSGPADHRDGVAARRSPARATSTSPAASRASRACSRR